MLQYSKFAMDCKGKFEKLSGQELLDYAKDVIDECFDLDPCNPVQSEGIKEDMDTLGSLCDKLSIVTVRMWHAQDDLYRFRRMTPEEWQEEFGDDPDKVRQILVRACELNLQRNQLTDEIDQLHSDSLAMDEEEKKKLVAKKHKQY